MTNDFVDFKLTILLTVTLLLVSAVSSCLGSRATATIPRGVGVHVFLVSNAAKNDTVVNKMLQSWRNLAPDVYFEVVESSDRDSDNAYRYRDVQQQQQQQHHYQQQQQQQQEEQQHQQRHCKELASRLSICETKFRAGMLAENTNLCAVFDLHAVAFDSAHTGGGKALNIALSMVPDDAQLLGLGGHHIEHECSHRAEFPWTRAITWSGLYAFAIPVTQLGVVRSALDAFVAKQSEAVCDERSFIEQINAYLATPLLVDRVRNVEIDAPWQGKPHWLTFERPYLKSSCSVAELHDMAAGVVREQTQATMSRTRSVPTVLALVFPQFHNDSLNDDLWGPGMTDWDSLRASPRVNRDGRAIPRPLPEIGFYDLNSFETRKRYARQAKFYGVGGFIFHHYWFNEPRYPGPTLASPLLEMLHDGEPDIPFALHWANEPWIRAWFQKPKGAAPPNGVLQQQYFPDPSDSRVRQHWIFLRQFFAHPNYIRVAGRPVFLLYRQPPRLTPILQQFRKWAVDDGLPGLHLVASLNDMHAIAQTGQTRHYARPTKEFALCGNSFK